jgi:hypothetical protein
VATVAREQAMRTLFTAEHLAAPMASFRTQLWPTAKTDEQPGTAIRHATQCRILIALVPHPMAVLIGRRRGCKTYLNLNQCNGTAQRSSYLTLHCGRQLAAADWIQPATS